MAKVTIIPSTINPITNIPIGSTIKKKVAAYARVSTDSDEQSTSYDAQVNFYTNFIQAKEEWEFVKVYADEGISGTNTKKRVQFNQMIQDALDGKIDMIITKSISRFARNTVDTITNVRKLSAKGIDVFFEKENLHSMGAQGEMMLTILASLAQEESRSISQNVTMGKRWGFKEGRVSFAYKRFLGFKKTINGFEIIPEEAELVRYIYREFLIKGRTSTSIATELNELKIPTPSKEKDAIWRGNNIMSILTNEKYKGDALLQKKYITDFLEHKLVKNEGQIPQYYVQGCLPKIIETEEWDMVQTEIERRKRYQGSYTGKNPFATKLVCADCGGFYGQKVWHSTDKYRKTIYQCNSKFDKSHEKCQTPIVTEEQVKSLFVKAYNELLSKKSNIIEDSIEIKNLLGDTTELDSIIEEQAAELEIVGELVDKLVKSNCNKAQDQEEYLKKYNELSKRFETAKKKLEDAQKEKSYKNGQSLRLEGFIERLKESKEFITEWDSEIWNLMLNESLVNRDGSITFKFKNGTEITEK